MTSPSPDKALVLWNKMQNFGSAFLTEIATIRAQLGDDRSFANWCFDDLHIPLVTITRVTDILQRADADRSKRELASARAAEQAQRAQDSAARKAALEADRQRRAEEKATLAAEKARQEVLKQQEEQRQKKKLQKRANNAGWKAKLREEKRTALAKLAEANTIRFPNPFSTKSDTEIIQRLQVVLKHQVTIREQWIDNAVELGGLLCEARRRLPAHQNFSAWLKENDIEINKNDRAALLNLGLNMQAMRILLQQTDSMSYQLIWENVKPQIEMRQN